VGATGRDVGLVVLMAGASSGTSSLGVALGKLWGAAVDTAIAQCHAYGHPGTGDTSGTKPGRAPGPTSFEISVLPPRCPASHTGTPGETQVTYRVPATMPIGIALAPVRMRHVQPGTLDSPTPHLAAAPQHLAPGTTSVTVGIDPALERGLYLGEMAPAPTSAAATAAAGPSVAVLIYLDGYL
jgi:hypothetical protein